MNPVDALGGGRTMERMRTALMDARTFPGQDLSGKPLLAALGPLSAETAVQALAAASDVALLVDGDGTIRDLTLGSADLADHGLSEWLGRPWAETVLPENRTKIEEMLTGSSVGRWRQVNHPSVAGDLPMRYLVLPAGDDGRMVAVGRDMRAAAALQQRLLRAQQSMERDLLRLRQLEARYRLLFDTASEAIMVVDAATRLVAEANPAARRLVGAATPEALVGRPFAGAVAEADREAAVALLGAAAVADQRPPETLAMASGADCRISATLFRQDRGNFLLVRLQPVQGATLASGGGERALAAVLERMPDAFVLTDQRMNILAVNGLFLDMVQQARAGDVTGTALGRFIGRPGIDLGLLAAQLRDHGAVRSFSTVARGLDGSEETVEISGVTSAEGSEMRFGFSIRRINRALSEALEGPPMPRSVEQLTELVGRVPLKEIVRESTDLIERLCIEAALTYTSDNRASAAEILGLSRQSLYSKLHRHGLGNLDIDSD